MSNQQLWDMVNSADTFDKIHAAEKAVHEHTQDIDTFDDMMMALSYTSRDLYRQDGLIIY